MNKPEAIEILLIEDNDYDAELTLRALKMYHLANQIIRFADGQEALDYLFQLDVPDKAEKRPNPKLIMLDLKLPGLNGHDVLKAIRDNPSTRFIPVVTLTSSTEEEDVVKSYALGVNSFVSKPVEFDNFMETVKNLGLYWMLMNKTP